MTKRILYVNRRAPHGTIYGLEALEAILVGAAFEQDVSVLFLDDGVYQLLAHQAPAALGFKDYAKGFRSLALYDIDEIYVEAKALEDRGLRPEDLLMPVTRLGAERIAALMEAQDVILGF